MAQLRLFLFGAPRIERDAQPIPLRRTKALALLAYLAVTQQPQDREALLGLLWPEFDEDSARNNLRRELSLLKTIVGDEALIADRLAVAWNPQTGAWLDIAAFQAQLAIARQARQGSAEPSEAAAAALTEATQLYRDHFLSGFSLPTCPAFDEWQFFQREELRQQLAQALQALISWHADQGAYDEALVYARRWLALDTLHEPAQRELMRLYALAGQHAAALRQYEECVRLLEAELGAAPETETTALYAAIKARQVAPPSIQPTPQVALAASGRPAQPRAEGPRPPPAVNLPPPLGGFVGRERELADILRRLTDPDCRLLTLAGPGGIGKTRLAVRAARILAEEWASEAQLADGVLFVPLETVSSADGFVAALAAAAQLDFYPDLPPRRQLLDFFRPRHALIVLDNFEPLPELVDLTASLLAVAPGLRLLVTSREALNLQEEWFHPVEGLSFPGERDGVPSVAQLARFDAVQLFDLHARRVRSDFKLSHEREHVVRLCRLVEGMPLAIELAASWLKALSVEQIGIALERGLDILTSRDRDIPVRHRSMRTVLEEVWRQLSAEEQRILAGLSVFSGGFSPDAAEAVTGASLAALATLVDKSLLRRGRDGRFQLHELLRQFAAERLREAPDTVEELTARHRQFFVDRAERAQQELSGPQQQAWVEQLSADHENIRAVLRRAQASGDGATLLRLCGALWQFWDIRTYRSEGRAWLREALAQEEAEGDEPELMTRRAQALRGAGTLALNQDDYVTAEQYFTASLAAYEQVGDLQGIEIAINNLGLVEWYKGNLIAARSYFERSLVLSSQSGSSWNHDAVTHNLASILALQGDIATARPLFEQSLALSRERGDTLSVLISLVDYAFALANHCDYAGAEALAAECLALSREAGNNQLTSDALGVLGQIAVLQGASERGRSLLEQALGLSREIDHGKSTPIDTLVYLGLALLSEGDLAEAIDQLRTALSVARRITRGTQMVLALRGIACAVSVVGDAARAVQLFGAADALSRAQGQPLLPAESVMTLPYERAARATLGTHRSIEAWVEGQALSAEAACALALELDA